MVHNLYKYRFYSPADQAFRVIWNDTPPTTHHGQPIDQTSVTIVDNIGQNTVQIKSDPNDTSGNYLLEGLRIDIPSGQNMYTYMHSFPVPISCFSVYLQATQSNLNDTVSAYLRYPNTPIQANVEIGQSNIQIDSLLEGILMPGFYISLSNNHTVQDLGRIRSINTSNHTIATEAASSNVFVTANTTMLCKRYYVRNLTMAIQDTIRVGEGVIGGTFIPANVPIFIEYKNNNSGLPAKQLHCQIEYNY